MTLITSISNPFWAGANTIFWLPPSRLIGHTGQLIILRLFVKGAIMEYWCLFVFIKSQPQ